MTNFQHMIFAYLNGTGLVWIYALVILVVFIYTVIKLKKQARKAEGIAKKPSADLLKARYERGEISKEEYEKKKKQVGRK